MIEKIKSMFSKDSPKETPNHQDTSLYNYWINQYRRAVKNQPTEMWKSAEDRFNAKDKPFVNDFRKLYESSMAFLDQQDPSFKITAEEAFLGDIAAQKQSECDSIYLKKVWREQHCQKFQSQKLSSALVRNFGVTMPYFDIKKWLPALKYIPASHVLIDPDCDGMIENAQWMGYWENVPAEEFRSWHPEISTDKLEKICSSSHSTLTELERENIPEEDKKLYSAVKVIHIYARNSAAVVIKEDDKAKDLPKSIAEELQLDTPRKYYQFVEGYPLPIVKDKWPYDLDHDEFPLTILQFNRVPEDIYGFSDYKQMQHLDEISDDVIKDISKASYWASVLKFLGRENVSVDPVELENFLNDPNDSYLDRMLDSEGNPKITPMPRSTINSALMNAYTLLHDQSKEASGMSELLENADASTFKDVTAIAARIADANQHQRINRRLGGPFGYEQSIAEDAIKMLEIAHQFVPKYSTVAVMEPQAQVDEMGTPITDMMGQLVMGEEQETLKELRWDEALQAISQGGRLIKLGVDAIVGDELAQFWSYGLPAQSWILNTKVAVEPGTTRIITREQQAAVHKQLFLEVIQPFLMQTGRIDLAARWIESIARLSGVANIENMLPSASDMTGVMQQRQMMQQMQTGQAGGQPLNSPDANNGEVQNADL